MKKSVILKNISIDVLWKSRYCGCTDLKIIQGKENSINGKEIFMKKGKKMTAAILAATMMMLALAGCASKNEEGQDASQGNASMEYSMGDTEKETASTEKENEFAEKLTVTWWGPADYANGAQEGTYGELLIEELINVDIKPTFYDNEAYKSVRPVELAGGNIPDFMYLMDPVDVKQAVEQGFIMEIPFEMIKKYAPTYYEMINEVSPKTWIFSNYEGKNYGVVNTNPGGEAAKLSLWRMDWLEKVGINKVPETLEEMEAAFDAFVNQDPDGNGVDDTYALSGDFKNWHMCFTDIFGAFGILPFDWMDDGNGGVTYGALLPETKEVLELLAGWYQKGYIHPDCITDSYFDSTITGKFKNGRIGFVINGQIGDLNDGSDGSMISILRQLDPGAECTLGLPIKGPDGKSGTFAWGNSGHILTFGSHLKDDPEKVIRILKLVEMAYTDEELAIKLHMGEEGVHWEYIPEEEWGKSATSYQFVEGLRDKAQYRAAGFNQPVNVTSYWGMFPVSLDVASRFWTDYNKEYDETYLSKAREVGMSDLFLKPDSLPSAGQYIGDLRNLQLVAFAKIITGEEPVDYYDTFVEEWKAAGGEILLEEAQSMQAVVDDVLQRAGAVE